MPFSPTSRSTPPDSRAPAPALIPATGAAMRSGRAPINARMPKSVTETARAARSGHMPAWAVRFGQRKKEHADRHARGEREIDTRRKPAGPHRHGRSRSLPTDQHDGHDCQRDAEYRQRPEAFTAQYAGDDGYHHRTHGRRRSHDGHPPHGQRPIQQRHADAAGNRPLNGHTRATAALPDSPPQRALDAPRSAPGPVVFCRCRSDRMDRGRWDRLRAYLSLGSANTKTPLPPRGLRSSGMRSAGRIVAQLEPPIDGPARNATNCLPSTA